MRIPRTSVLVAALASTLLLLLGSCGSDASSEGAGSGTSDSTDTEGPSSSGDDGGTRVDVGGDEALVWGEGTYGVVLAHGAAFDAASWEPQATRIAEAGMVVIAVENIDPSAIVAAADFLRDERGATDVAFVGGSAGTAGIMEAVAAGDGDPDQLILLSPNSVVDGLGTEPKLFIASEDEPVADVSTEMADTAEGDDNEAIILPGSAHAQNIFDSDQGEKTVQAILDRLTEFADA